MFKSRGPRPLETPEIKRSCIFWGMLTYSYMGSERWEGMAKKY